MKFKLKSKHPGGEFNGFILEAVNLDDAANKLYELKGVAEYPTLDDYTIEEYEEKRGRKRKFGKSESINIRFPNELYSRIPGNKSDFIREAVAHYLKTVKTI